MKWRAAITEPEADKKSPAETKLGGRKSSDGHPLREQGSCHLLKMNSRSHPPDGENPAGTHVHVGER